MAFFRKNKTAVSTDIESTIANTPDDTQNVQATADTQHTQATADTRQEAVTEEQQAPAENEAANETLVHRNIYNLIILDESGSMMSIYNSALSGMNETLQTIRAAQDIHPEQTHFVTLVSFNSSRYNKIYDCVAACDANDITDEQYRPNSGTPLYDAMGRAINELRARVKEGDVVLVTIITDGYENASHEYSGRAIKALVESLKTQGWVFTYIGANQDVEFVAGNMAIDNFMAFKADEESTKAMFLKERLSRNRFFNKVSTQCFCKEDISKDYFDVDDED